MANERCDHRWVGPEFGHACCRPYRHNGAHKCPCGAVTTAPREEEAQTMEAAS